MRIAGVVAVFFAVMVPGSGAVSANGPGLVERPFETSAEPKPGVVLQLVPAESALRDLPIGIFSPFYVTEWQRVDSEGTVLACWPVESAFHWTWLEIEQAPRGGIRLIGKQKGGEVFYDIGPGSWNLRVIPPIADVAAVQGWGFALLMIGGGNLDGAAERLAAIYPRARELGVPWAEPLGQMLLAMGAFEYDQPGRAAALIDEVLATHDDPYVRVYALELAAEQRQTLGDLARAAEAQGRALALRRATWGGETLGVARSQQALAELAFETGRLIEAHALARSALALRRQLAPGSLVEAQSLVQVGAIEVLLERLVARAPTIPIGDLERALGIFEEQAPTPCVLAVAHTNLGAAYLQRGELERAGELLDRAAEEARTGGCPDQAAIALDRGLLAWRRGRLDEAETFLNDVENDGTNHRWVIESLYTRGLLAWERGDDHGAREQIEAGLALARGPSASVLHRVHGRVLLAALDLELDALDRARLGLDEAEALARALAPELPLSLAAVRASQGDLWRRSGQVETDPVRRRQLFEKARASYEEANRLRMGLDEAHPDRLDGRLDRLEIAFYLGCCDGGSSGSVLAPEDHAELAAVLGLLEHHAPDSLRQAEALFFAAMVADGPAERRSILERSVAIERRLAPGSELESQMEFALGETARLAGAPHRARQHYAASLAALEQREARLGVGPAIYGRYRSSVLLRYQRAIENLIALGEPAAAFEVTERSRARVFLRQLGETAGVGGARLAEARQVQRGLDAIDWRLRRWTADDPDPGPLLARRTKLLGRREDLQVPVAERVEAPVLDLATIRGTLGEGTVILSYLVYPETSYLLVVREGRVTSHRLGVDSAELAAEVAELRGLVGQDPRKPRHRWASFVAVSRRLHDLLIAPASEAIRGAERLLVLADGPLHGLPFTTLMTSDKPAGEHFLVEEAPLVRALSASALAHQLERTEGLGGRSGAGPRWTAFVDPIPFAGSGGAAATPGCRFTDLPALVEARQEVEGLARLFGADRVRIFAGADATERNYTALGEHPDGGAEIVHFATHAAACPGLESAILLGASEGEDGLLKAREILDGPELGGGLVVLSACETALGDEQPGEGLEGLARAFQIAGASSVVASLWQVGDQATRHLMERFYGHLLAGEERDRALWRAQLDRRAAGEPPGAWAAFELHGAW